MALATLCGWTSPAGAQEQGFASERFYAAAPGAGWMVMDDLDMRGGLGGAVSMSGGYARNPLRVSDGTQRVSVVSDQAFAGIGVAATYDRFRFYLDFTSPLVVQGESGTVGGHSFAGPSATVGSNPDTMADARIGFDARLFGDPKGPFRFGLGAQFFFPSGQRSDYLTDGTYRAMLRALFAGNVGLLAYAGHLGVHVRPLDDTPVPGSPRGSELLFGASAGPRFRVDDAGRTVIVVGPEIYGESALSSLFGSTTTGVEGLLTGRIEGTADDGPELQFKLGAGGGIDPHFGAPEWRCVFAIALFDHDTDTDRDGVSDARDACPSAPGATTKDPKTNGCPLDRDGDGVPDAEDACPDAAGASAIDPTRAGCPQ